MHLLNDAIEKIEDGKKIILFFDEVPWLASPRSKFLNALEHFWNRYMSRNKNIIMVICGSAASWIIRNIIKNKGGLHGRVTRRLRLLPFTLQETEQYLKSQQIDLGKKQVIDLYMAFGGVPKYLSYIKRGKSATQNINDICFTLNGGLYDEFDNLYRSLFTHCEHHIAIIKALSETAQGLTKEEILAKTKITSGGTSSKFFEELVDAGFIIRVPSFGKKKKGEIYHLIDEYTLFYLTWIEMNSNISMDEEFWMKNRNSQVARMERLCF